MYSVRSSSFERGRQGSVACEDGEIDCLVVVEVHAVHEIVMRGAIDRYCVPINPRAGDEVSPIWG